MVDFRPIDSSYALILTDLWNQHWCKGATKRVGELAPVVNEVIISARAKGALIIHAPSDTMGYYKDSGARQNAERAPFQSLDGPHVQGVDLPIDDSGGGCDDTPHCSQGTPWTRQHAAIIVDEEKDAVSDTIQEIYNLFTSKNIENVIVMGVHVNMCILHTRPFSLNTLVALKNVGKLKQVYLLRDLTDTMYDHRKNPKIDHFAGTDLVVKYIEEKWCPTMLSSQILGGTPFRFTDDQRPRYPNWRGKKARLKCLGASGDRRWLKANENGSVSLVPDTSQATAWSLVEIGPSLYSFNGNDSGLYLDGNPSNGKVELQANNSPTGTRWYVEQVSSARNYYTLKCCGKNGDYRYLGGNSNDGHVTMQADKGPTGTGWEISIVD
jgi:nicotinamidase-related amidase